MKTFNGLAASKGIAIGQVHLYHKILDSNHPKLQQLQGMSLEKAKHTFFEAIEDAKAYLSDLEEKTAQEIGKDEAAIFEAQALMLDDEDLQDAVLERLEEGKPLDQALQETSDQFFETFRNMDSDYFQERAYDVKDAINHVLESIIGEKASTGLRNLQQDCIIVAEELTPSDTAEMNKSAVLGFITEKGGPTSHVAIIARTLEVPAVVGITEIFTKIENGITAIVDGVDGKIVIHPDSATIEHYTKLQQELRSKRKKLEKFKDKKAKTKDGRQIDVQANIGALEEVELALTYGAEGIGLLRTEFLYLGRNQPPEEEELFDIVKQILTEMEDKPVILRTLDIGGDKAIEYFNLEKEANPFLGFRGSRFISNEKYAKYIKVQLRAAYRASAFGHLKIMFPMISTYREIIQLKELAKEVQNELTEEGLDFDKEVELGIMIEVPSVAVCAELLAPHVDFFSIGTNDLTQYTLAADRTNDAVAYIFDHYHPAIFRLIKMVATAAHQHNKWVGICGELASDPLVLPVLVGLDIDELSMSPPSILAIKKTLSTLTQETCTKITEQVLHMVDVKQVHEYLEQNSTSD